MKKGRRTARRKSCPIQSPSGSGSIRETGFSAVSESAAATRPRNVGAGVSGRDESQEAKWHPTAGATEFLGIAEADSARANPATQQVVTGGRFSRKRASSGATASEPRTRPEHTAAGSKNQHGAARNAVFPGRMVMGLLDASNGACGEVCLRERIRVFAASLRKTTEF